MKIRQGFVTNSSSSSFVVVFERLPKDKQDLKNMLFGDKEFVTGYDERATTEYVAGRVFEDMIEKPFSEDQTWINWKIADFWEVASELDGGSAPGAPDIYNLTSHGWYRSSDGYNQRYVKGDKVVTREDGSTYRQTDIDWDLWHSDVRDHAYNTTKDLFESLDEKYPFIFSYADDGGDSLLEHGGIFDGLGKDRVIRISHH